jgi:putative hydrolase of HD superfamily
MQHRGKVKFSARHKISSFASRISKTIFPPLTKPPASAIMRYMEKNKMTFEDSLITLFGKIHPLERIERAGYVLRGVVHPETVAAHSHFLSLLTLLVSQRHPQLFDCGKAMAMAVIHDLPESVLMDIPMPASDQFLKREKEKAEQAIFAELFGSFMETNRDLYSEFTERKTNEAKLVAGLDKVQMMIKVLCYERENRGRLGEFWENPANFRDYGLEPVSLLFDAVCKQAGKKRPG